MKNLTKLIYSIVFSTLLFFYFVDFSNAQCVVVQSGGPDTPAGDYCISNCTSGTGIGSCGRTEYSCANYFLPSFVGYGCYWNVYVCENPSCSGSGSTGGTGGSCANPEAWDIDCPAGQIKTNNLLSSQCLVGAYCPGPGTAQSLGTCCEWINPPQTCGPWYDCGTAANPDKQCRVCDDPDPYCSIYNLDTYQCIDECRATPPTSIQASNITQSSADFNWINGLGSQILLRAGENRLEVLSGCYNVYSPACNVSASLTGYAPPTTIFPAQNMYYFNVNTNSCGMTTSLYTDAQSCMNNLQTYMPGATSGICYQTLNQCNTYARGSYSLTNLNPDTDYYFRIVSFIDSSCYKDILISFKTTQAPFVNTTAWWQVKDADVMTNGSLSSEVPSGQVFGLPGAGGFPGIPVYGSSFNLLADPIRISWNRWNANTNISTSKLFNYDYFESLIPATVQFNNVANLSSGGGVADPNGYEWFKYTGNLNTSGDIDFGSRKVILFVEQGSLNIGGKINLTDGVGFFGAFVENDITIDRYVTGSPSMEGIYLANGNFLTGDGYFDANGSFIGSLPLHIRGSIASFGTVSLQRNLADNTTPAELFEFAPDQLLLFPEQLRFTRAKWSEVAP